MTLDRLIQAIQRTSHLSAYQMRTQFPELYKIQREERLEEIRSNTNKAVRRILGEN